MKTVKLADEIRKRSIQCGNTGFAGEEIVIIRMTDIEEAVKVWDKARRDRAKLFKRQALAQKFQ